MSNSTHSSPSETIVSNGTDPVSIACTAACAEKWAAYEAAVGTDAQEAAYVAYSAAWRNAVLKAAGRKLGDYINQFPDKEYRDDLWERSGYKGSDGKSCEPLLVLLRQEDGGDVYGLESEGQVQGYLWSGQGDTLFSDDGEDYE